MPTGVYDRTKSKPRPKQKKAERKMRALGMQIHHLYQSQIDPNYYDDAEPPDPLRSSWWRIEEWTANHYLDGTSRPAQRRTSNRKSNW